MSTTMTDIQKGMDVYGADGEKIGSVSEADGSSADQSIDTDAVPTGSGGGMGALGDESRVYSDTGTAGGPGNLGDDARVYADTGTAGGPGTLGDESRVYGEGPQGEGGELGAGQTGVGNLGTDTGYGGATEVDIVAVETTSTGGGYGTDIGTSSMSSGTGFFKVSQGGILGIGAKELYIPYDAVQDVQPGDSVRLNVTKDQAASMYSTEPGSDG